MNAITQQECPPDMRGRILALTAVAFLGSYPIGGPITGIIGDDDQRSSGRSRYGAIITMVAVLGLVWWALGARPGDVAVRRVARACSARPSRRQRPNPAETVRR